MYFLSFFFPSFLPSFFLSFFVCFSLVSPSYFSLSPSLLFNHFRLPLSSLFPHFSTSPSLILYLYFLSFFLSFFSLCYSLTLFYLTVFDSFAFLSFSRSHLTYSFISLPLTLSHCLSLYILPAENTLILSPEVGVLGITLNCF